MSDLLALTPDERAQFIASRSKSEGCALGLTVIGFITIVGVPLQWAIAIGMFTGARRFVPYMGFGAALLSGLAYALAAETIHPLIPLVTAETFAIAVVAAVALAELLKNIVYEPIILGGSVKLHPLVVVIGVVAGATLFGPAGMFLAIPTITVESEVGRGTVFTLELPVEARGVGSEDRLVEPAPSGSPKRVLVVDDEPDIADLLADLLAPDGHHVETAIDGASALQKLEHGSYDVILSDLRMPELDGPGLYREVERRYPQLAKRFIFLSGDTLSPQTREFLERVELPSVGKPFDPDEVRRAVYRVP